MILLVIQIPSMVVKQKIFVTVMKSVEKYSDSILIDCMYVY